MTEDLFEELYKSKRFGTLYIEVTTTVARRIFEHKNNQEDGFSKRYNVHTLVYYEVFETVTEAISREKQLKHWKREWKKELIEKKNPNREDLYRDVLE